MRVLKSNKTFHTFSQVEFYYDDEYVVYYSNAIVYYKDGMLHREFGPAIKSKDGTFEMYMRNNKIHNLYDAAIVHLDSSRSKFYYLNGIFLDKKRWEETRKYYMSRLGDIL